MQEWGQDGEADEEEEDDDIDDEDEEDEEEKKAAKKQEEAAKKAEDAFWNQKSGNKGSNSLLRDPKLGVGSLKNDNKRKTRR